MSDWNLEDAIRSAKEDGDWEQDVEPESGSIHISVKLQNGIPVDFQATGAGLKPQPKAVPTKPVTYDGLPAIATKNVRPQDVYNVSVFFCDESTFNFNRCDNSRKFFGSLTGVVTASRIWTTVACRRDLVTSRGLSFFVPSLIFKGVCTLSFQLFRLFSFLCRLVSVITKQ